MENELSKTKPRILFFGNTMDRSEVAIAKGIINRGYEFKIFIDPNCTRINEIRKSGLPLEYFTAKSRLDFKATKKLRKILKETKPDIIYAPTNKTLATALRASKKLPIKIIGYRGTIGHLSKYNPASWFTHLHPRLSHIISVSEAVRQHLINDVKIVAEKITTIYKGHNPEWYAHPDKIDLQSLGVPENAVTVGFAGNMRPVKGVDILIKALDYLPPETKIHLLLIGDVRDKTVEKLISMPKYKNRLTLTGFRSDAPSIINACNIFVMPSIEREGLPRAVIEAMTMKIPVIVSDVGGMPEQIINNECGLVVPPSNPKALADAIQKLATSPELCSNFGNAALMRIQSQFNIKTTINSMCGVFNKIHAQNKST